MPNFDFRPPRRTIFLFLLSAVFVLSSCGTPGEPRPPQPTVPEAITDLAAKQAGGSVVLTFTLPSKSTEGLLLEAPPEIEIFRALAPAGAAPPKRDALKQIYTVPPALVDTYLREGRIEFTDPIKPDELRQHTAAGSETAVQAVYVVRARASERRASDDSNVVTVRLFAVPEAIADLRASVTESAIELRWTAPARTTLGTPISALAGYRVYRAEIEMGSESADLAKAKFKSPVELLGVAPSPSYRDAEFEFGRAYIYTVRSVAQAGADSVESADSRPVGIAPRDTFPPAPPRDLVVVLVPAAAETRAQIELSWGINTETDLAGYIVYRSEADGGQPAGRWARLNRELLLVPTFRDISVEAGRRFFYRVTAIDRAGNESQPSAAVAESVPSSGPVRQ